MVVPRDEKPVEERPEVAPAPVEQSVQEVTAPATRPSAGTASPRRPPLSVIPSGATVAVIPIEGTIYDFTTDSLKRRIKRAARRAPPSSSSSWTRPAA